jgi:hypothetical protein
MDEDLSLAELILPAEIFTHFDLIGVKKEENQINIYLDEKNNTPKNNTNTYISKGFTEQSIIQDFPIRSKAVFLFVRRRKWLDKETGKVITTQFDLAHLGTHLSTEFAAFLKDIHRK